MFPFCSLNCFTSTFVFFCRSTPHNFDLLCVFFPVSGGVLRDGFPFLWPIILSFYPIFSLSFLLLFFTTDYKSFKSYSVIRFLSIVIVGCRNTIPEVCSQGFILDFDRVKRLVLIFGWHTRYYYTRQFTFSQAFLVEFSKTGIGLIISIAYNSRLPCEAFRSGNVIVGLSVLVGLCP